MRMPGMRWILAAATIVVVAAVATVLWMRHSSSDRSCHTVSGLSARKKAITAAGGETLDLAVAMLENEDMKADYTYGDGKKDDSANFGVFKQNWYMIRNSGRASSPARLPPSTPTAPC